MFNVLYIDPGTGSMLISSIIAVFSVMFFVLKEKAYNLFGKKGDKGEYFDTSKHYKLVYYSEGKQYWNVFKPLLEEGSKRSIKAVYLTSDKDDPGLKTDIDGVTSVYIGTGREAYYKLNKLKADVVVMTTPGLDVLGIKRSKDVKHYSHITHATSSGATYKTYGTDYFDSVLVGGEGTHDLIRELEQNRNIPAKDIKIIGHTYLDVYRNIIKKEKYDYTLFKTKRPTILISPTWGDHGLLSVYGDDLLSKLSRNKKYNIIIRPHPQSFISDKEIMDELMEKYPNKSNLIWNTDRENLKAMSHADIMISDFSGIIFDYYTLFDNPILTITSQYEKRGREAMDLTDEPWDLKILNKVGKTLKAKDIKNINKIIDETIKNKNIKQESNKELKNLVDKYPGKSAVRGIDFIEKILDETKEEHSEIIEESTTSLFENGFVLKDKTFKGFLKAIFQPEFLFQVVVSTVIIFGYTFIGLHILPNPGLNVEFLSAFRRYSIISVILSSVTFITSLWLISKGEFNYINKKEKLDLKDFGLVLLLLTPIIQYIFANQDTLKFFDSLLLLIIFSIVGIITTNIIPTLISPVISKVFTVPISLSFTYIIINMASFGRTTRNLEIILIMLSIIGISFIFMFFDRKKTLILLVTVLFLTNSLVSFVTLRREVNKANVTQTSVLLDNVKSKTIKNKTNIYFMIYDSYANEETLNLYGIDNKEQTEYLLNKGFAIYDGTYSIGADSLTSMAQALNIGYISGDPIRKAFRQHVAGEASLLKLLKKENYDTHFLSSGDYLTFGYEPDYTTAFPSTLQSIKPYVFIGKAILEGEFRFNAESSTATREDFLYAKANVLTSDNHNPEFLYHHSYFPGHSQNSGVLLPDETEIYERSLRTANEQMKIDLNNLNIDTTNSIIIIAGDHGPYLTKNGIGLSPDYETHEVNRLDIQDRNGMFLAIHWPDKEYINKHKIETLQDVLPAVLSYMYEDDELFLKIKMSNNVEANKIIGFTGIKDGIIVGGIDDGKPLFEKRGIRVK